MALPSPSSSTAALITGASSGIGAALAHRLAARGHAVLLVARGAEKLEALAQELAAKHGVAAHALPCDLADAAARDDLAARVEATGREVSVLVNNAGFGTYSAFADSDRARELEEVRLNVEAVVDLTSRYLAGMVRRGSGAVLITASTAAFQPMPGCATYAATKGFDLMFAEALHRENRTTGVTVTALCSGPVRTGFQAASGSEEHAKSLPGPLWRSADQVADAAIAGLEKGRRVVVPGAPNRVLAAAGRHAPRSAVLAVTDVA